MIAIVPCEHCGSREGMKLKTRECVTCGKVRPRVYSKQEQALQQAMIAAGDIVDMANAFVEARDVKGLVNYASNIRSICKAGLDDGSSQ